MPAEETWGRRPDATAYVRGKLAEGAETSKRREIKNVSSYSKEKKGKKMN